MKSNSFSTTLAVAIISLLILLESSAIIVISSVTAIPVPSRTPHLFATVACGGKVRGKRKCEVLTKTVMKTDQYGVRCCSNEGQFPFARFKDSPKCGLWAGSKGGPDSVCNKAATYDEAVKHCGNVSARLCTEDELLHKCAKNTGCNSLNKKLVWALDLEEEKDPNPFCNLVRADKWIQKMNLNAFGDDPETFYMGGTPLFDERTNTSTYRYDYLVEKFPTPLPWMTDDFTCDDTVTYPECMADYPSRIGDSVCDELWNTKECGYDGGDCKK